MGAVSLHLLFLLTMSKRKLSQNLSSKHLNLYKKSYKGGGIKDLHFGVFQDSLRLTSPTRVLYPGCHRHLTAALVFDNVTFIDCDRKVAPLYSDPVAREYVETNKAYEQDAQYRFYCHDVNNNMPEIKKQKHDLLISLSAGAIVKPCSQYISQGGYLLVNDSHNDARTAFVSGDWQLMAYWDDNKDVFSTDDLDRCFQVIQKQSKNTTPITKEQVEESVAVGTVSKRSFKPLTEPMFFLFQKK